jgi:hypothetical protein
MESVLVVWRNELQGQDAWIARTATGALILLPKWLEGTMHGADLLRDALAHLAGLEVPAAVA